MLREAVAEGSEPARMTTMTPAASPVLLESLTAKALERHAPTREEMLALLGTSDDEILDVVAAASRVRRAFFGMRVSSTTW